MGDLFYIFCIITFLIVLVLSWFLLRFINKEIKLYKMFTRSDKMRTLMAKDPLRFHTSIIYLMTYMARSDGNAVKYDKIAIIIKYIREVCPSEYRKEAISVLKTLTDREYGSGKNRRTESLIDIEVFNQGRKNCLMQGDDSFHYSYDLHGTKLAGELGQHLSEDDRLYVMYLLYRLAIEDGKITTTGKYSEREILYRLCVKGLKIDESEFKSLLASFTTGRSQEWYDRHFGDKGFRYPVSEELGNIFRHDTNTSEPTERVVPEISVLSKVTCLFIFISIILGIVLIVFICYKSDLMGDVYPEWFLIVGIGAAILVPTVSGLGITVLESSQLPILRTETENSLQKQGLLVSSVLSVIVLILLHFGVSNMLFLIGNEHFGSVNEIRVTTPIQSKYTVSGKRTSYHVRIRGVQLSDKTIVYEKKMRVSRPNELCLKTLKLWSGMTLKDVKNTRTKSELTVSSNEYYSDNNKAVLRFKVGYYGLVYYDGYWLE